MSSLGSSRNEGMRAAVQSLPSNQAPCTISAESTTRSLEVLRRVSNSEHGRAQLIADGGVPALCGLALCWIPGVGRQVGYTYNNGDDSRDTTLQLLERAASILAKLVYWDKADRCAVMVCDECNSGVWLTLLRAHGFANGLKEALALPLCRLLNAVLQVPDCAVAPAVRGPLALLHAPFPPPVPPCPSLTLLLPAAQCDRGAKNVGKYGRGVETLLALLREQLSSAGSGSAPGSSSTGSYSVELLEATLRPLSLLAASSSDNVTAIFKAGGFVDVITSLQLTSPSGSGGLAGSSAGAGAGAGTSGGDRIMTAGAGSAELGLAAAAAVAAVAAAAAAPQAPPQAVALAAIDVLSMAKSAKQIAALSQRLVPAALRLLALGYGAELTAKLLLLLLQVLGCYCCCC
jgi:hypothetical protein